MAVILVTHDLGVIAGHADRVAVMYAGKIAETAGTDQVFAHARHPYTVALFDALPERVTQAGERLRTIPGMPPDLSAPLAGCAFAPRCANAQDACRQRPPLPRTRARLRLLPGDVLLQSADPARATKPTRTPNRRRREARQPRPAGPSTSEASAASGQRRRPRPPTRPPGRSWPAAR